MAFKFPFTNYHELNLTWVLEQLNKLFEESNENVETIEGYEDRLSAVEEELPVVEATAEQAATVANAAATLAQTAKSTADTANENALTASAQAGLARQEAAAAEAEAQAATQAAQQAQATVQNFDGRITQAENDASEALQEAQSFENRVDAAINTANNAANTATIAQGIAVNANQNAATALDTAQTADGKAEAAQDAADIADGKAEAAQDTADQNAANIGNLSDLTTTAKNNLVAAINEAAQTGGGGTDNTKAPLIVSESSGLVASFSDGANNMQIQELICNIEPAQDGTGDPSPTNVRPISGHAGMLLGRNGKNWCNNNAYASYISANIPMIVSNTPISSPYVTPAPYSGAGFIVPVIKGATYTLSSDATGVNNGVYWGIYENVDAMSSGSNCLQYGRGTTLTANYSGYLLFLRINSTGDVTVTWTYAQCELGSTASTYEPYTGTTIPITWETEARTVYRGTLDVMSGKLIVTHKFVTLVGANTESWGNYSASYGGYSLILSDANIDGIPSQQLVSNQFIGDTSRGIMQNWSAGKMLSYYSIADNKYVWFTTDITDRTQWIAWLANNPTQLVYPIAEPVEYTLTPHELTTLYGVNNIWTDVGSIQSCKYPADTKLYIDGKVAELQALILEN